MTTTRRSHCCLAGGGIQNMASIFAGALACLIALPIQGVKAQPQTVRQDGQPRTISDDDLHRLDVRAKGVDRLSYTSIKGWNIPFGDLSTTMLQDKNGFRTELAERGFGFGASSSLSAAYNLNGTHHGYRNLIYWGQEPSFSNNAQILLTYDLSRHGISDGQIVLGAAVMLSTWNNYTPQRSTINNLSYYQTFLNKRFELKAGFVGNNMEWIGAAVGGSTVNPLGQATSIQYMMGLASLPTGQPTLKLKWNASAEAYLQLGAMRSLPINGPAGNVFVDDASVNESGLKWKVPNGRRLLVAESGYQRRSSPSHKAVWFRAGVMDNASTFVNYETGGVSHGATAHYFLIDSQVTQPSADSIFSAYRGLHLGATYMKAPEQNLAFHKQYELRAYYLAPQWSRPLDIAAVVYARNDVSNNLQSSVNRFSPITSIYATDKSESLTAMYTGYITQGIWGTIGISYTEDPVITYSKPKDKVVNLIFNVYVRL